MDGSTIYVSGNPDLYPVEYYDSKDEIFAGAIPKVLEAFSEETGYDLVYYEADGRDHRENHQSHVQVDILSGVEEKPETGEWVPVFESEEDGTAVSYGIVFTEAAPDAFQRELTTYIEGLSGKEKTGLLIGSAMESQSRKYRDKEVLGTLMVLTFAAFALGILAFRYRKKMRQNEKKLRQDHVTGLGNREYLGRYYSQFVNDHNRIMYAMYYFRVDISRLERTSGQKAGADVIRHAGTVLSDYAGEAGVLARVSENGIVLLKLVGKDQENSDWIPIAEERIREYGNQAYQTGSVHVCAGVYPLRQTDRNLEDIIANARMSAHMAYREHVDFRICSDDLLEKFREEKMLEGDISRALLNGEFQMYLQFYTGTKNKTICGAEVLARWMHPAKGLLMPGMWLPALERTGWIGNVDFLMLEHACSFLERNLAQTGEEFFLSCNFSRTTFGAPDFVSKCKEIMEGYQFDRKRLVFELTKSFKESDAEQIRKNAVEMKSYGIRLMLDDFGAGDMSFMDLLDYPVDMVKLDRSLTKQVLDRKGKEFIKALIRAEHEMSMICLAGGVEDEPVFTALKELSCDAVQGDSIYYQLPEPEAEEVLLRERADSAL